MSILTDYIRVCSATIANAILLEKPIGPLRHYQIHLTKLSKEGQDAWQVLYPLVMEIARIIELKDPIIYEGDKDITNILIPNVVHSILEDILKEVKAIYVEPKPNEPDPDFRAKLLRGETLVKH